MKRFIATVLGLSLLTGCGTAQAPTDQATHQTDPTNSVTAQSVAPQENTSLEAITSITPAPAPTQAVGDDASNTSAPAPAGEITLDEAKGIALSDAGLTQEEVTFVKGKRDFDDGIAVYDIEFYANGSKYEYEIAAQNGTLVSKEVEAPEESPQLSAKIDMEAAKAAALNATGLTSDEAVFVKTEMDRDDGRVVYEIELVAGNMEYSFEISGDDGTVLEQEIESVYD